MIRLVDLAVGAGGFRLEDVSLDVPPGAHAVVLGPTGAGKTTLLEAVAGHLPLLRGRVELGGVDATRLPPERRGVGFVYQAYHLFPHLSVRANIAYGLPADGDGRRAARVAELALALGITPLLERGVAGLSGGEQQRVALARALAPSPRVLLLDEPFAAVDPATRGALRRELRALHERERFTILHVTHDFAEARRLADTALVLMEGRVVQQGTPAEVLARPATAAVAAFVRGDAELRAAGEEVG